MNTIQSITSQDIYQGVVSEPVEETPMLFQNEPEFIWSDEGDSLHITLSTPSENKNIPTKKRQDLSIKLSDRLMIEADVLPGKRSQPTLKASYTPPKWQGYIHLSPENLNQYQGQMGFNTQIGKTQLNPYLDSSMSIVKHPKSPKIGVGYEVNGGLNLAHQFSHNLGISAGVQIPLKNQLMPTTSQISTGVNLFNSRINTGGYIGFQEGQARAAGAQVSLKPVEGLTLSGKVGQQPKGLNASGNLKVKFNLPTFH